MCPDRTPRSSAALQVGERVVVEPVLPCGTWYFCRRGHPNVCPRMSHLGIWRDGNYADYVSVPAWRATRDRRDLGKIAVAHRSTSIPV